MDDEQNQEQYMLAKAEMLKANAEMLKALLQVHERYYKFAGNLNNIASAKIKEIMNQL